ncbi:MAG TPA: aminotransferase class I/II-fold pyridoxal phosphate-dependent enzyme [Solirubrobacteraceae bacterium]|jgi:aspartate/methionine/tyrosine aminotransferase
MQIEPFEIERFYERWEFRAELMLSSSDCESRSVAALLALEPDAVERLHELRLGYTEVPGSAELCAAVASLYEHAAPEDVLTLAAAEEGIFLANHALLTSGDHAIVEAPCYGSAITLARSTGAEVTLWERHAHDGWRHDLGALETALRPNTKLIYVNSPHNPTGTHMPADVYERVIELARDRDAVLLGDEVYRGLEHDSSLRLPQASDRYERAISLNTVSKAYGLPGLRIGWVVCRDPEVLAKLRAMKLYTTICSSAPSEVLVALALRHSEQLIGESRELVLANLALLDGLIERRGELFGWHRPTAGPIGFAHVSGVEDVRGWCESIAEEAGVLLLPGEVYGVPDHVRLGYGRARIAEAIARLEQWLDRAG